jgi:imidazolonepropionase-like amidohydrolase
MTRESATAHVLALVAAAGMAAGTRAPQPRQRVDVALRAARWLDVEAGRYQGPSVILVAGGRITDIADAGRVGEERASRVIDLGEAVTVLPGLIDAHVHLQIGGEPRANAAAALRAGFTTVVDLGATTDAVLRLREAEAAGAAEAPRILAAGLWVGTTGGVCDFNGIGLSGGPDAFRARVRDNVAAGADLIKVCVSGWTADAFERPAAYEIADASLAAVVDEAHRRERLVIAHAISRGGVEALVRSGADGLAHAAYLDLDAARELRSRGVFMIPTLASLLPATPGPAAAALGESVRLAYRSGVPLVFGTDGGVLPHGRNAQEFAALVEAGLTPLDAIRTATLNAARALRSSESFGSIAVGRSADIVGVAGDPLRDVGALARPTFVMHRGRVVVEALGR